MSQFMESDLPQVVILQDQLKMLRHIIRPDWLPEIIHIDIITFMIAVATEFAVFLLMFFHLKQQPSVFRN